MQLYAAIRSGLDKHVSGILRLTDIGWMFFAALTAHGLRFGDLSLNSEYWVALLAIIFGYMGLAQVLDVYSGHRIQYLTQQVVRVSVALLATFFGLFSLFFFAKVGAEFSRLWAIYWLGMTLFGLVASRVMVKHIVRHYLKRGTWQRRVFLVGAAAHLLPVLKRYQKQGLGELHIEGVYVRPNKDTNALHMEDVNALKLPTAIKLYTTLDGFMKAAIAAHADDILITDGVYQLPLDSKEMFKIRQLPSNISFVLPKPFWQLPRNFNAELGGLPLVLVSHMPLSGRSLWLKRACDIAISLVGLIPCIPLFAVVMALIKLEDGGPIFFMQRRNGFNGEVFGVYKFRSMSVMENGGDFVQAKQGDNRITKVGKWLRKLSIDELPQIFNVLKGEMSWVGPRPHAEKHNEEFEELIDVYAVRNRILPGITGWAQVNGWRGETDTLEKMEQRVRHDIYYVENWSVWLDMKILFLTFLKVPFQKNVF